MEAVGIQGLVQGHTGSPQHKQESPTAAIFIIAQALFQSRDQHQVMLQFLCFMFPQLETKHSWWLDYRTFHQKLSWTVSHLSFQRLHSNSSTVTTCALTHGTNKPQGQSCPPNNYISYFLQAKKSTASKKHTHTHTLRTLKDIKPWSVSSQNLFPSLLTRYQENPRRIQAGYDLSRSSSAASCWKQGQQGGARQWQGAKAFSHFQRCHEQTKQLETSEMNLTPFVSSATTLFASI